MHKWEFKTLGFLWDRKTSSWSWGDGENSQSGQERLNDLGQEGWEIVSVISRTGENVGMDGIVYYFKRPIE